MILMRYLSRDVYDRVTKEVPRLFADVKITEDSLLVVVLDDNAILKTSNARECVTFDLGGHLVDIDRRDFASIIIT